MKTARTAELSSTEATVLSEAELLAILSRVTGLSANTKPLGKTGEDKRRPETTVRQGHHLFLYLVSYHMTFLVRHSGAQSATYTLYR